MTEIKCARSSITLKNVGGIFTIFVFILTTAVYLGKGLVVYKLQKQGAHCAPLDPHALARPNISTLPDTNPCSKSNTKPDKQTLEMFNMAVTSEENNIFKNLLTEFSKIATGNGLDFVLCGGSLLGSYRHHGMIPWDDDLDIMMNFTQQKALKAAFQLSSNLSLDTSTIRWKVYSDSGIPIKSIRWKWPFLDISFFNQNSSHLWDGDQKHFSKTCFPQSWVFPTILRPFWDLWLPAPRYTYRALKREFDIDMCASSSYNHKRETSRGKTQQILCKSMCDSVPLVSRHAPNDSIIIETLYIGNKRLSSVALDNTQQNEFISFF